MHEDPPSVPVIGPLFYRRSVRTMAGDAGNGDARAVRTLAGIAAGTPDAAVRKIAAGAFCSLSSQEAIDAFCSEVLELADPALEGIALSCGYAPSDPALRALFLYLTGQEEALCRSDPGADHPFLARGYAAAPPSIRTRAQRSAGNPRLADILARTLMGTDPVRNAGTWSHGEWEVVTAYLTSTGAWEDLWLLAFSAPPSTAVPALHAMKTSGWRPPSDDRRVFDELARDLPDAWNCPVPEKPLISIDNQDSRCLQLAFSPDGSLLATGNCYGGVAMWQVSSARLLASMTTDAGSIGFLAFTPDNSCLISGGTTGHSAVPASLRGRSSGRTGTGTTGSHPRYCPVTVRRLLPANRAGGLSASGAGRERPSWKYTATRLPSPPSALRRTGRPSLQGMPTGRCAAGITGQAGRYGRYRAPAVWSGPLPSRGRETSCLWSMNTPPRYQGREHRRTRTDVLRVLRPSGLPRNITGATDGRNRQR